MRRREFVGAASGFVASGVLGRGVALHLPPRIRAVAFDGFAIFDATAVLPVAEAVAPGKGRELMTAWRSRHFEYQWLRTLGGQYADFQRTADDALAFAAHALGLEVTAADRARLVSAQAELRPWNDTSAAVRELRAAGLRLALLSNMTERMLVDGLRRAGLADAFEFVLSTDRVRAAKPAREAYAMGQSTFGLLRDEIAFVAFAGWDVAGATWFGYPTAWLNRAAAAPEQLAAEARIVASELPPIVRWLTSGG
jgi:2-haloacid dehalogenase